MVNRFDIAYSIGLGLSAPAWFLVPRMRRKVLEALRERRGDVETSGASGLTIFVHAVSNGELNAIGSLIKTLRGDVPGVRFVVSTSTRTGVEEARKQYGATADVQLLRFPLDFTSRVSNVLDRLKPAVVVLMELEVWPNFVLQCARRKIPVIVANGRISTGSYRQYKLARPLLGKTFRRLAKVCVQDDEYARRFIAVGVPKANVVVAGTMKFDTAQLADRIEGDADLAEAVGVHPGVDPIWVCGSTGPGEEEIILRVYRDLLSHHARLRLVIVPRHKPRFDEVAALIASMKFRCVRRSKPNEPIGEGMLPAVVLGDTFGELRKFYSLADVIFVGRSLVDLGSKQHGSDMIEAAALAKPIVVGPWTGNFSDAMRKLRQAEAILICEHEQQLREEIDMLLTSHQNAAAMARRAQDVVRREQGATRRHADVILSVIGSSSSFAEKPWKIIGDPQLTTDR